MKLAKSLLLGAAAGFAAVAGAQAADLPSRKSAPVAYVKICDAYGAGFFYIPGTDTCLKVGGYVRAEYQYTPGQAAYSVGQGTFTSVTVGGVTTNTLTTGSIGGISGGSTGVLLGAGSGLSFVQPTAGPGAGIPGQPIQVRNAFDTTGTEVRGRVELDARTPTAFGTVRTAVRLRATNSSGLRNTSPVNNAPYTLTSGNATQSITIESAYVQWAGFTFGVAPENYAMMPSMMYNSNPWAGFPNGMKQIAYTATFGGGFSATLALEERADFGFVTPGSNFHQPTSGYELVGNVRIDQSWGFAAIHGILGNSSVSSGYSLTPANGGNAVAPTALGSVTTSSAANNLLFGNKTEGGYAVGATVKFNLPMIAAGDAVWFTANYADGMLGGIGSAGAVQNLATASARRVAGGITTIISPVVITGGTGTLLNPFTIKNTTGWNVAMAATHYWAPQWRSNFSAGYVSYSPPRVSPGSVANPTASPFQWGNSHVYEVAASLIYSPAKNFDIGLEVQYLNFKTSIQNLALSNGNFGVNGTFINGIAQTTRGLSGNNFSTHLRIERQF